MKTYFDIAYDDINTACDEINKMKIEGDTSSKGMDLILTTLLVYNIANVADELHMLRKAIEEKKQKEGLSDGCRHNNNIQEKSGTFWYC